MFPKLSRFFFSHTCCYIFEKLCFLSEPIFTLCCQLLLLLSPMALLNFHLPPNLSFMAYISSTVCHWFLTLSLQLPAPFNFQPTFLFFFIFFSSYFFNQESKSQQVDFSVIRILSLHPTQAEIPQDVPYLYAAIIFTDKNCPIDFLLKLKDH